jgi:DNA adenine methylase
MSSFKGHLLFSYPGSKWNLGKKYAGLLPPHTTWVDVFGGTGAMLIRKPPSDVEVFNDLDTDVITVFKVIKSRQYHELVRLLQGTRNTRQQYELCRAILDNPNETPVRRAWSFITCGQIGFSIHPILTRSFTNSVKGTSRLKNCPSWLAEWRKRLKGVVIENEPWQAIIDKYDSDDTVFVLDPPYMPGVLRKKIDGYYQHHLSAAGHIELLDRIQTIKGKAFVCGYHHPAYLRRLWHWRRETFDRKTALNNNAAARQEQVWLNYDADGNRLIGNRKWITEQFLALAGRDDCEKARLLIGLLEDITRLAKGANGTFSSQGRATRKENASWLAYTSDGSKCLDNRLWIGKHFVETAGGFDEAQRMLATACSE